MNDTRRLLKFKYGSGSEEEFKKCLVKFETLRGDGEYDVFTFECDDEPHPDLKKKLEAMIPFLLENCEFEADPAHKITVKSITCTHKAMDSFDVHGLVISGLRELKHCNAPMNLTSPHKTDRAYSDEDEGYDNLLSSACLNALDELVVEIFAYVDGKRAQLELGLDADEKPAEIPA